ncbi:tax1-binding protein 1 homolog isoform X4 [Dreissena polymorpha]|uniref:tax1-binding protein 1 homolog isoform X4 n=1 Tax=Dreissena polymorpha TaxID=45954 RepID=UPI0022640B62|nr:tax1-binding protein 1 homolog isoform X4 [Dreissena polymorpha]
MYRIMSETQDDIVIDEVITVEGPEAKSDRAEFAKVVFHNIAETYPEDAHIECNYTVTSDLVPTTRDWVALYKVGWMNPRDYYYYEWAPMPKDYQEGKDAEASVLFPAHKLPKDDGEFYQFCYVSSSKQIRGASTPFQFRRPGSEDYVEVEDEETNMLVIRSKTIFLEESLQKAETQKLKLKEAQDALQKERDSIITKYQETKHRLAAIETENVTLKGQAAKHEEQVAQLRSEVKNMLTLKDELELKIQKIEEEKDAIMEENKTILADLEKMRSEMKRLQNEKDELSGKNAALEEQAEMYKSHYTNSESNMEQYTRHNEDLQIRLAQQDSLVDHLKDTVQKLTDELDDNKQNLDQLTAINLLEKDRSNELRQQLKTVEDQLSAAEERKCILQKEITSYRDTQQELSRQIEKSKTECDSVKHKLCALEEDFTKKTVIQKTEMVQLSMDLHAAIKEKEKMQTENEVLHAELFTHQESSEVKVGSMSIMKQSLTQIKDRLEKKEKHCRNLEKSMRGREDDFLTREREMRREIEDLKEKIYMCSEEYKAIYIEKSRLQRKLEKAAGRRKSRSDRKDPMMESDAMQKSAPHDEGSVTSMTSAIDRQMEELKMDLDQKLTKKEKYKNLYFSERRHRESLECELSEMNSELERLRQRNPEQATYSVKIMALEKCVQSKDAEIEQLNQKLRALVQGRHDESGASMSGGRSPMGPPAHCYPLAYPYPSQPYPLNVPLKYPGVPQKYPQYPLQQAPYPLQQACVAPIVYPGQAQYTQQTPLVYPGQAPPIPPRDLKPFPLEPCRPLAPEFGVEGCKGAGPVETGILRPLPAPLEPERTPAAKLAAVKSASVLDEFDPPCQRIEMHKTEQKEASEDRFFDAQGVPMKICTECQQTFPADIPEDVFLEHQVSHFAMLCPQCKMTKPDDMSEHDFNKHVNSHFDQPINHLAREMHGGLEFD